MSGKKDKASRRLTASVDKKMKNHLRKLGEATKIDHVKVIAVYNNYLRTMPIHKKFRFAFSLFFGGVIQKCKNYILFWK